VLSMRGVFNPSILNHGAAGCRAALLLAWMQSARTQKTRG